MQRVTREEPRNGRASVMTQAERALAALHLRARVAPAIAALPVSYTHFRAHETLRQLVCRLLLEKKNIIEYVSMY